MRFHQSEATASIVSASHQSLIGSRNRVHRGRASRSMADNEDMFRWLPLQSGDKSFRMSRVSNVTLRWWFSGVDEFTFELEHANLFTTRPINLNNGSKMIQFVETKGWPAVDRRRVAKTVPCRWSVTHSPARCHLDTDFTHKKRLRNRWLSRGGAFNAAGWRNLML